MGQTILLKQVVEQDFTEGILNLRLDGRFADGLYLVQFHEAGGGVLVGKFEEVRK